ncbi:hypothetical protein MSPP1_002182 [Malassezia sp. CBS 17886]|nr:hypothetical protein MSPP1_002182 [Malassezia sp. CBS 17886]
MHDGSFEFVDIPSYAPTLRVHVPLAALDSRSCRVYVLAPLPPALYYDPYTARINATQPVQRVDPLGYLELERHAGWTAQSHADAEFVPRSWWEGSMLESAFLDPPLDRKVRDTSSLLPPGHAHLQTLLDEHLALPRGAHVYSSLSPLLSEGDTMLPLPVGDTALYPTVQLVTMLAVLAATLCVMRMH